MVVIQEDSLVLSSRRYWAAGLGAAVALALTACGVDQINSAAVVGDTRITVPELQDEARAVAAVESADAEPTGDQSQVQRAILSSRIQHLLLAEVARDQDVDVPEAEVDTFIADQLAAQAPDGDLTTLLVQNSLTEESLRDAVRDQLIFQRLVEKAGGQEQVLELIEETEAELGVEVNPRYGSWSNLQLEPGSGSISIEPGAES